MKIALVTDAWLPQINGVVTTLSHTRQELERLGHEVRMITPDMFRTLPCPSYPEIRLALMPAKRLRRMLQSFNPDAVHIVTEGPLGLAGRAWCLNNKFPFTTSFHTRFPEYVKLRLRVPLKFTYSFLRWFHRPASHTLVATAALKHELEKQGFSRLALWSRGVNTEFFCPRAKSFLPDPRPIFMYMGRVAIEKNIEAFLDLDLPGTKYVVGDGPDLEMLKRRYPQVQFVGCKTGLELVRHLAAADVFVFPSKTDTFGLVMLEALACGVPVAAYPVCGPLDLIVNGETGYLDQDLRLAAMKALALNHPKCRKLALKYTWAKCTEQFLTHLDIEDNRQGPVSAVAQTSAR